MIRYRWLIAILVLLNGGNFSHAAGHPSECWCIPAIQRHAPVQTDTSPTVVVTPNEKSFGIFDESLEKTAERLYEEAVKLDDDGKSERAAEKFVALLEQCPAYPLRDDVVKRLSEIARKWMADARDGKQDWIADSRAFVVPTPTSRELFGGTIEKQEQTREVLDTIRQTGNRKIVDAETFIWGSKPPEYPEGWDWIEDVLLEVDVFHGNNAGLTAGPDRWILNTSIVLDGPVPTTPSRRWFSSRWKQQIMMQLQLVGFYHAPYPPCFGSCWGGYYR